MSPRRDRLYVRGHGRAGRSSLISNISGTRAAEWLEGDDATVLGARTTPSLSDVSRVQRTSSRFSSLTSSCPERAPSRRASRAWLGGALVLGAALPLLAGIMRDLTARRSPRAWKACWRRPRISPSSSRARTSRAAGATSRGSTDTVERLLAVVRQYGLPARAQFQDRQRHLPQALGLRACVHRRRPTGSVRCSTRAAVRAAI